MIGSTANIVALGMLEKHGGSKITFFQWFKIGLLCTLISGLIGVGALLALQKYMPDHKITVEKMAKNPGEYHDQSAKFTGILKVDGDTARLSVNKKQCFKVTGSPEKVRELDGKKVTVSGTLQEDRENSSCKYQLQIKEIAPVESEK